MLKEGIKMAYGKKYHSEVHNKLLSNEKYYLFRAKCADKFYWKYLRGRVLEFGCGLGQNIFLHKEACLGIDVSEFALEECKKKDIGVEKDIKKIENGNFDSLLCCHVLEHLKNPYEIVEEFYRVLKPGGRLVMILPFSKKNRPIKDFKSDVAKHLYNWNFNAINELLNDVGFKVILNEFNYAYGYSKVYRFTFSWALFLLGLLGRLRGKKEMLIVAEK